MKIRIRSIALMFLVTLVLILQTACGGDGGKDSYCPNGDSPESIYFPRINFDTIDFDSILISADTPHGYIGHFYVRYISTYLPSRVPFTYRELDAALWIVQMLHAKGFDESQVQLQTFSYYDVIDWDDYFGWGLPGLNDITQQCWTAGHELRLYSQNVILTIPGRSTQTIIIGAHYDSLRYEGTSDNAAGVALLMENAQRMLAYDNYYTLTYVFFGANEVGILGTFYFYESLSTEERENIIFYINADSLLEGPALAISSGAGYDFQPNDLSEQFKIFADSFNRTHGIDFNSSWHIIGSDQFLFLYRGHTTLAFWGMDPEHFTNFLHSPQDSYDYISSQFPGMIERAMNSFALLLEAVLLERF